MTTLVLATIFTTPAAQASTDYDRSNDGAVSYSAQNDATSRTWDAARGSEDGESSSEGGRDRLRSPASCCHRSTSSTLAALTQRLRHGVSERRTATWTHQDWLGYPRAKTAYRERQTRSTPYLRWLKSRWAHRAHRLWGLRLRTLRDFEVRVGSNAWLRAVEEAQRPYPGTSSWLKSCSSTEGGWGRWVPNNQGAPPGGWLQFYESTFWRMWATAKADVQARGYRLPSSAASWYSPLGQALAGAWGLTNGRRHEWNSSGC